MKLVHPLLCQPIEFKENFANVLVMESKQEFAAFIYELMHQHESDEGRFVLSENSKELQLKKYAELIINPFSLDINQKKIINGVLQSLCKIAESEEYFFQTRELLGSVNQYIEMLLEESDYPIIYEESEIINLLKSVNVSVADDSASLLEKIVDYMKLTRQLLGIRCFIFVNLLLYLDEQDVELLMQSIKYEKYNVLLVEALCPEKRDDMKITVIDKDLCEIIY